MLYAKTTSRADLIHDSLHCLERLWRRLAKPVFDSYRPEKHYMRGPGPKHRAKKSSGSDVSPSRSSPSSVGNPADSNQSTTALGANNTSYAKLFSVDHLIRRQF
jgi:hypothetical protein